MTEQTETSVYTTEENEQIEEITTALKNGSYQKMVCIIEYDDENTGIYVGRTGPREAIALLKYGAFSLWYSTMEAIVGQLEPKQ